MTAWAILGLAIAVAFGCAAITDGLKCIAREIYRASEKEKS